MDELLARLETRIKALLQRHNLLEDTNHHLNQSRSSLAREKDLLLAKNKAAVSQIELMVSRLKSIESAQ